MYTTVFELDILKLDVIISFYVRLYHFSPDPTLTVREASTVLHKVEDWRRVMGLFVPPARMAVLDQLHSADEQRKSATIEHYVGTHPVSSWEGLSCALYECEETEAVAAVKTRLPNEKGVWAWN